MIRIRTVLAISALAVAAPALAGEIDGNGDSTPIRGFVAGSICSFSGLNDEYYVDGDLAAGRVQSYGQIVRAFGGPPPFPGPGLACRGS